MRRLALTIIIIMLTSFPVSSFTVSEIELPEEMLSKIPAEVKEAVEDANLLFNADGLSKLESNFFIGFIMRVLSILLRSVLKNFCILFGIVVIGSLLSLLRESFKPQTSTIMDLICTLVLASVSYEVISEQIGKVSNMLTQINIFMNGMLGIMSTLYITGGNAATAVASGGTMAAALTLMENLSTFVLVPLLRICFVLTLVSAINEAFNLSGFTAFIRNIFTVALTFIMSILASILSFQSIIAQGADSTAIRTFKFAASSFIPIIGSTVAEAVRTISGSITLLRGVSGGTAIIVILILTIPILLSLFMNRAVFSLCSGGAKLLGETREGTFLGETTQLYDFMIAVTAAFALMFILSLTLFARTAAALGA